MSSSNDELEQLREAIKDLPEGNPLELPLPDYEGTHLVCYTDDLIALESRLTAAEERERVLRKAVEHYADRGTWIDGNYDGEPDRPILYWDGVSRCSDDYANGYDIAQAALDAAVDAGGATEDVSKSKTPSNTNAN